MEVDRAWHLPPTRLGVKEIATSVIGWVSSSWLVQVHKSVHKGLVWLVPRFGIRPNPPMRRSGPSRGCTAGASSPACLQSESSYSIHLLWLKRLQFARLAAAFESAPHWRRKRRLAATRELDAVTGVGGAAD